MMISLLVNYSVESREYFLLGDPGNEILAELILN